MDEVILVIIGSNIRTTLVEARPCNKITHSKIEIVNLILTVFYKVPISALSYLVLTHFHNKMGCSSKICNSIRSLKMTSQITIIKISIQVRYKSICMINRDRLITHFLTDYTISILIYSKNFVYVACYIVKNLI